MSYSMVNNGNSIDNRSLIGNGNPMGIRDLDVFQIDPYVRDSRGFTDFRGSRISYRSAKGDKTAQEYRNFLVENGSLIKKMAKVDVFKSSQI